MRWFNLLMAVFYLSLLVTTDAGITHDSRLSPLADSPYQALHAENSSQSQTKGHNEQDPDEPDSLVSVATAQTSNLPTLVNSLYQAPWLSHRSNPDSIRAPPVV
jgi:hypothetical protein